MSNMSVWGKEGRFMRALFTLQSARLHVVADSEAWSILRDAEERVIASVLENRSIADMAHWIDDLVFVGVTRSPSDCVR